MHSVMLTGEIPGSAAITPTPKLSTRQSAINAGLRRL